jgi:hypothetical protein
MRLRTILSVCFIAATLLPSSAQERLPAKAPLPLHHPLEEKNFYLFSALERDGSVRDALIADPTLSRIGTEREDFLELALHTCKNDVSCTLKPLIWTEEEIGAVSLALRSLYQQDSGLRAMLEDVRAGGAYVLFEKQSGEDLLVNAWETSARGVNDIIAVYGEGAAPRYPKIDSISYDTQSPEFEQRITALAGEISAGGSTPEIFFQPSLKAALELLEMNHRDEAGRFEPMQNTENKAALSEIGSISWSKYRYSVIVVPGAGPNDPNVALSDAGRKRTALAAQRYREGAAPLILVSGGYVHPSQTRFSEAIEMKRALLDDYHVPESAILVDPHARHTTTNMRNAAREIYRYKIPMDKPALAVSDAGQIRYIESQGFADRCMRELGYMPYRIVNRVFDTDLAFLPQIQSLEEDPLDPLDP